MLLCGWCGVCEKSNGVAVMSRPESTPEDPGKVEKSVMSEMLDAFAVAARELERRGKTEDAAALRNAIADQEAKGVR